MSEKMMIFYSFSLNFLWKSLMTLMTVTLMTGFLILSIQLVTPSVVAIAVRMLMAI